MIVWGTSEDQLDEFITRLKQESGADFDVGGLEIAYRETFIKNVNVDYAQDARLDGSRQFGRIKIAVSRGMRGGGINFIDETDESVIPRRFIAAIEKGVREQAECGYLAGYPIRNFDVRLKGGAFNEEDSSAASFEMAGRGALREAARKAGVKLLEPIMDLEVVTPEDCLEGVVADLIDRRGRILATEGHGSIRTVQAHVPLARLTGYRNDLRARTQDQAQYTMRYSHFGDVPLGRIAPDDPSPVANALRA